MPLAYHGKPYTRQGHPDTVQAGVLHFYSARLNANTVYCRRAFYRKSIE